MKAESNTEFPGRPAIASNGTNFLVVTYRQEVPSGLVGVMVSGKGVRLNQFQITSHFTRYITVAAASDGTNFLVLYDRDFALYGVRISAQGDVLDPENGFPVAQGGPDGGLDFKPELAFGGSDYLAVWSRIKHTDFDVVGARILPSGQVLAEIPVAADPGEQTAATITFGAGNYLVAWRDTKAGTGPNELTDILGRRVSSQGVVLDPEAIAICTAPHEQREPHTAFDGHNYFVVWRDQRQYDFYSFHDIYGARVSPAGVLLDGPANSGGIVINNAYLEYKEDPRVCFDGRDFLVTWWMATFNPPAGAFAARVSTNDVLIDGPPDGLNIQLREPNHYGSRIAHPNPAFNGQTTLVAWLDNSELGGTFKEVFASQVVPRPRITDVVFESEDVAKVTFATRPRLGYRVEESSDLSHWSALGVSLSGTGSPVPATVVFPGGRAATYFRVRVEY